jgi:hypothetical protein
MNTTTLGNNIKIQPVREVQPNQLLRKNHMHQPPSGKPLSDPQKEAHLEVIWVKRIHLKDHH